MSDRAKWDMKLLGKLKDHGNFLFTKENSTIRFNLEIISNPPINLPENALKFLTSFSDELESLGFIDDITLNQEERFEFLEEFLQAHYIMFKIKSKHKEDDKSFYNAYDLEIRRKESDDENTFYPIPFLKTYAGNTDDTLKKLFNNEYLQGNISISKEKDDYPSFLLIGEYEHSSSENLSAGKAGDKIIAFGPIKEVAYSEEFGFKFITDKEKTFYKELKSSELGEYYLSKDRVMFITTDRDNLITESLKQEGQTIQIKDAKPKIEDINEIEFLKQFEDVALSKQLSYNASDLSNFHTAMKTQGFVILAGMSGTGKSRIVQCYHEALNKFSNKSNKKFPTEQSKLLFVPVRPFWQDDSDLLGYLDSSQGIYRPGESGLVDFIKEANEMPDECYIVCLDEMNLAKVEHYFSQFLSVLERDNKDRVINLYNDKLNGRVYNQNDYPPTLVLGENLFFVGTVNLDESTFQFSDKVLDRANVITLGLSPFKNIRNNIKEYKSKKEEKDQLSNDIETSLEPLKTYSKLKSMRKSNNIDFLTDEEVALLWDINLEMQKANKQLGVGYRIIVQIENYIVNLPNTNNLDRRTALDLQITQRILTKLRGSQGQLSALVGKYDTEKYIEGSLYELLNRSEELSDFKMAKVKIQILAKELEEYGHTI